MSQKAGYPKFSPELHLITCVNSDDNTKTKTKAQIPTKTETKAKTKYKFDIRKLNILSPECKSYLEPLSHNCFPLFTDDCIKIIQWELNNWLLTKDKCDCLKKFEKDKTFSFLNFESPTMKNCISMLPFSYEAFTHPSTTELLSSHLGFPIELVMDYEIAHFAKKIDSHNRHIVEKMNLGVSSKVIIRKKSVAYPYICLIKINPNDICDALPVGYAFFLKGRLIENLAGKIIYNKNTDNEMVLCPSYVPKQINLYENYKQSQNKVVCSQLYKSIPEEENDENIKRIKRYKTWLNRYYNSEGHAGDIQ